MNGDKTGSGENLTKAPGPLIIIAWCECESAKGAGGTHTPQAPTQEGRDMRVHVYRETNGIRTALVLPGRAMHKPPVLLKAATKEALMEGISAAVKEARAETGMHQEG